MGENDGARNGQDGKGGNGGSGEVIVVEGKEYKAEDIKGILEQQKQVGAHAEVVSKLKQIASKYGVDPEVYLGQAEGALSVIGQLIEEKIIDNEGNVIKKREKDAPKPPAGGDDPLERILRGQGDGGQEPPKGPDVEKLVLQAVQPLMKQIEDKVSELSGIQAGMLREEYTRRIKEKHPELEGDDISRIFGALQAGKVNDVWEAAKVVAEQKKERMAALRKKFADEWGVDLKKLEDENKLKEADGKGAAGVIGEGKKITFNPSGDDGVTPKEAAKAYLQRAFQGG